MPRKFSFVQNVFLFLLVIAIFIPFANASGPYVIGSANPVTADPLVPRPSTTPCVVQLFANAAFYDFNNEDFTFTPPADCPGPWAKVVLEADISLNPGVQYDRTANFWLGPVNIYFGTTAEPGPQLGPYWHIENDLTDYSSLFYTTQSGVASIGNTLCCGLSSTIYSSAAIEFYPLAPGQSAPVVADQVIALSAGPTGGTATLNTGSSRLTGTFTFPTNVQSAFLDVYSQSQINDEFWYTCVPNAVATELESCPNTAFRETEIAIDDQLAGVAPVFPWIFTGGLSDPFLWIPIPGIQTLNFTPYRVNLTPFVALLSDGKPHTISLGVYNADEYFSATASLLLYLDSGTAQVTGAVTENTLATPTPVITSKLNTTSTSITGTVGVSSKRSFTISGYANTSKGKVTTTVQQTVDFANNQTFNITDTQYVQDISQSTTVNSATTVTQNGSTTVYSRDYNWPLTVDLTELLESNGDIVLVETADQTYQRTANNTQNGNVTFTSSLSNKGQHADTIGFTSSFNYLGNSNMSSAQQYNYWDSTGYAYNCSITAAASALTSFTPGCDQ
jgi:hypothetical protein